MVLKYILDAKASKTAIQGNAIQECISWNAELSGSIMLANVQGEDAY